MSKKKLTLWLDERWYDALSRHLRDESVEDKLEAYLDALIDQLPDQVCRRISQEIWREEQQARQEQEASRRFAVFHVTENGNSIHFTVDEPLETLDAAVRLRDYVRKPANEAPVRFTGMFSRGTRISQEQFDAYVTERLDNTGRVTGAFDIDLDKGECSALHGSPRNSGRSPAKRVRPEKEEQRNERALAGGRSEGYEACDDADGWQTFSVNDVCAAVHFSITEGGTSLDQRWSSFLDHLDGRQLTADTECGLLQGERELTGNDIFFSGEVLQDDPFLEFYMDVAFDADAVLGTHVCTTENDDYLNVYAKNDLEAGQVCDTLTVILFHDEGETDARYRLSEQEQAAMLPKMDSCCQQQLGLTLEQCRERYLAEELEAQSSPELEM